MPKGGFNGFPAEAIEFFEGLEADNSRAYWTANKDVYESCVRRPMAALLEELAPEFGEGRIFRPYRDVRFSKDKSPYKTTIAATVGSHGYVRLSAENLGAGAGIYGMAPDQVDRFRRAVDDPGKGEELVKLIESLTAAGIEVSSHDVLKTAPKGYAKDHPRIELLRYKDLVSWDEWPAGAWLGTTEAKSRVVGFLRATAPLTDWLERNVGETEIEGARRHR